MSASEAGVIAEFSDYGSLHVALRLVRERRNISFETLDEIVGAPKGYFSKVFAPKSERKITMQALGWAMNGLGVKAVLIDDPETLRQIESRLKTRDQKVVRAGGKHVVLSYRFMRRIAALGGQARNKKLSPARRRKIAKKAALIRWNDIKEAVKSCRKI